MVQLVTKVDDDLAAAVDELVAAGRFESRSDAVRWLLRDALDRDRRASIGQQILAGYAMLPETADELGQSMTATRAMIAEEPW